MDKKNPAWQRFQQLVGQSVLEVFKNIGPPPAGIDVNDLDFAAWTEDPVLPNRFPVAVGIRYAGKLQGTLWFVFSLGLVDRVVSAFLGRSLSELGSITADCSDALAEAANQLSGDLNIRLRKVYGDPIEVDPPKIGNLPDILRAGAGEFLVADVRVAIVTVSQENEEILVVVPDGSISKKFAAEGAEQTATATSTVSEPTATSTSKNGGTPSAPATEKPRSPEPTRVNYPDPTSAPPQPSTTPTPNATSHGTADYHNINLILDITLDVILRVGSRRMLLKDVMALSSGAVIELDKAITDPVEVRVNDKVVAYGEVVVVEGSYAIKITEIANRMERIRSLG